MKFNFLEHLKLPDNLKKEFKLEKAKLEINKKEKKKILKLYFNKENDFTPEDFKDFYLAILDFKNNNKDINIDFENIFLNLKKYKPTIFDVYSFLYFILQNITKQKIEMSKLYLDFYEKEKSEDMIILIANNNTYNLISNHIDFIRNIFTNFSILKAKLFIRQDASKFNFEKAIEETKKELTILTKKANINSSNKTTNNLLFRNFKELDPSLNQEKEKIFFNGEITDLEIKKIGKNNNVLLNISLKGENNKLVFASQWFLEKNFKFNFNKGDFLTLYGDWKFDNYLKDYKINIKKIEQTDGPFISKNLSDNRVRTEFHIHTKMSTMDGVGSIEEYFKLANKSNIKGLAFLDHDSVQAFPEIYRIGKKYPDIKKIYGSEFSIFDDINEKIVFNSRDEDLRKNNFIYFDLETTGISPFVNEIIEFGAVKIKNGIKIDRLQLFIKPSIKIPKIITKITKIKDDDLKDAPSIKEAIPKIIDFFEDYILVAHNAKFDYSFINAALVKLGEKRLKNPVIDSLKVSWIVNSHLKSHRLGSVAREENQHYDDSVSHRADYDAEVLKNVFENMLHKLYELNIRNLNQLEKEIKTDLIKGRLFLKHISVIAKNQKGLKDLYKLISIAHINFYNKRIDNPSLPLSEILRIANKGNLLIGSACANGIFWEELNYLSGNIEELISYYDYLEIFPPSVYSYLTRNERFTKEQIEKIILEIIKLGEKYQKPVIVSSDAHYVYREDKIIRDIFIVNKGLGGKLHPLFIRNNPNYSNPDQHLRLSKELEVEFKFIKDKKLREKIIYDNTNLLYEKILDVSPIKDKLYPPEIVNSDDNLKNLIKENLKKNYGEKPDRKIIERINREVNSITKHKFAIIYYLSSLVVKKSLQDGYLVGSRGSVGSSLAATLSDITEVNPLEPHYVCKKCKHHFFVDNVLSGYDLEDKKCPICNSLMKGEGHWIQFETFLGFNGDKVPDIDLNFSREYQAKIHDYVKEILGDKNVYRAGTISTVAERTAYGYVKNWEEITNQKLKQVQLKHFAKLVEGTKRTTGQHPGGLIVVPKDKEIYDFTPINFPGNDLKSNWLTTHFDFHSIHDNLLKLDLLGHLDPSLLKMLQSLTNINPQEIPMNDKKVISLFKNSEALNYIANYTGEDLGILGLPEFGTKFVRDLVRDAKPKTFSELVMISGLSHGTDVWLSNAKNLISEKKATLQEVISVRDDIMRYLISKNVPSLESFKIMESVRKGLGLTENWEKLMLSHNVPNWYIESCKKIKYIFPKAHAVAYVMMAYRIAWYKINYPLEYYATFFTKRDTEWDILSLNKGLDGICNWKTNYRNKIEKDRTERDKAINETYTIVLEMYSRGYKIAPINLEKSKAETWVIDKKDNLLIPPFIIIEGLGNAAAKKLVEENIKQRFISLEDFRLRSGLNKTLIKKFSELEISDNLVIKSEQKKQILIDDLFHFN
ncbi:PolC-type DNA polymerase III [Candidatus Hepatoplasma crinochetorum]|uniref:PolC-type DNA polymerase III n=1 Tax=Candidatus Hepatoplasma crinochetorum TaxID=295596 RepID=UPI00308F5E28|nr:MAG: DNA polymerase III PolC-type [Candidatus Hepatoplasma crinochetorum]